MLLVIAACSYNVVTIDDVQNLPLHDIILNQNYSTQDKLLLIKNILDNKIVDVNDQDVDGRTALNLVTFYKANPALARLLIEGYKANVNKPDRFNVSPLHNAIQYEEIEIADPVVLLGTFVKPIIKATITKTNIVPKPLNNNGFLLSTFLLTFFFDRLTIFHLFNN